MSLFTRRIKRSQKVYTVPVPSFSTAVGRAIPSPIYGITTEEVTPLPSLITAISSHVKRPMVRIVFQNGTDAAYYADAVGQLRNVSYIFGQLYDSTALKAATIADCQQRTRDFLSTYGESIDIYEIGNELNGEWVGNSQAEIDAKVTAIYNVIKNEFSSLNIKVAITLNYWPTSNYYAQPWEDTKTYAQNMSATLKNGADYLLLSFYETAGNPIYYPTNQDFAAIFGFLGTVFPNAKVGIGEIGAQGKVDGLPSDPTLAEKQRIANRYYGMHNAVKSLLGNMSDRYVGGYFWWYYYQDCVPKDKTNTLWPTLENNFNQY